MTTARALTAGLLTAVTAGCIVVTPAIASADDPAVFTPSRIDSVLVTDKDIDSFGVGFSEKTTDSSVPAWDTPEPGNHCQVAGSTTLMHTFTAYRRVEFDSFSNFTVAEAVAVYPSADDAKAAVLRYVDNASQCVKKDKQFFHADNSSQVTWSFPTANEVGEYAGNVFAANVQAMNNVVVFASSSRHENGVVLTEKIAGLTAQRVRDSV